MTATDRNPRHYEPDGYPKYVTVTAHVTDRWDGAQDAYLGSVAAWAWDDAGHRAIWKRDRRKMVLAERTSDPRGWRVTFTAVHDDDVPAEAPAP